MINKIKSFIKYIVDVKTILIVFITVAIVNFINKGADSPSFTASFSFASTITSIILSVLAIMYTFLDSYQSKSANDKIINSSNEITANTKELSNMIETIKSSVAGLNKIDELKYILDNIQNQNNSFSDMLHTVVNSKKEDNVDIALEFDEENLNAILRNCQFQIKRDLLFIYLSYKKHSSLDVFLFEKYYNEKLKNYYMSHYSVDVSIIATLNVFSALNLIDYEYVRGKTTSNDLTITKFNENLAKALDLFTSGPGNYGDVIDAREYGAVYDFYGVNESNLQEITNIT